METFNLSLGKSHREHTRLRWLIGDHETERTKAKIKATNTETRERPTENRNKGGRGRYPHPTLTPFHAKILSLCWVLIKACVPEQWVPAITRAW